MLRKIFKILAADELRHAACYAKYLRKAVANKPEVLPDILRMTLWMLRSTNDAPKHPTTVTEPGLRPARGPRVHQRACSTGTCPAATTRPRCSAASSR